MKKALYENPSNPLPVYARMNSYKSDVGEGSVIYCAS